MLSSAIVCSAVNLTQCIFHFVIAFSSQGVCFGYYFLSSISHLRMLMLSFTSLGTSNTAITILIPLFANYITYVCFYQ